MSKRKPVRKKADLRGVDNESSQYWNEILRREGLSMSAGQDTRLQYRGSDVELEKIESRLVSDLACGDGKRVRPTGAKPE